MTTVGGVHLLSLIGEINIGGINPALNEIHRDSRQQTGIRYELDSSQVTHFSSLALADICKMRKELTSKGSSVILTHCSEEIRRLMYIPLFQSLMK